LSGDESLFNPEDFLRYEARCRGVQEEAFRVPRRIVLLYQNDAFEYTKKILNGKLLQWFLGERLCIGIVDGNEIGVFRAWIGAPGAAAMLEELIVCGAKIVFEVGLAGGLQPSLEPGDIVVVTEAIRDEGTPNHYFTPDVRLESCDRLRKLLTKQLASEGIIHQVGSVWTTDGVYRETRGKFLKFSNQGVLAVNMETSALFAVGKYRDAEIASAQVISDMLTKEGWLPAFKQEKVSSSTHTLLKSVVKVLTRA